jgi:hypothetical protein
MVILLGGVVQYPCRSQEPARKEKSYQPGVGARDPGVPGTPLARVGERA